MRVGTAAVLLLAACSTGALAQATPSADVAQKALPTGTSAPPDDPFKNGGRPESNAGSVQQPHKRAAVQAPSPTLRQMLKDISRTTLTAQQYGNLASMRHTTGAMHDLGDRMAVTNSRINKALVAVDPELQTTEQMPPSERSTFDSLARQANENEFSVSVAQWVAQSYPPAIAALERIAPEPELGEMLTPSIAELKLQLADAQTILQTARAEQQAQPSGTGSVSRSPTPKSD